VAQASRNLNIPVPVVVRLQGTNAEEAKKILDESGLNIFSATTFEDAAQQVTKAIAKN
jgi:succinyl-CoA synthetase beta subunit